MKKLSKMEIDVVVSKVVNDINEIKENKGKRICHQDLDNPTEKNPIIH